MIGRRSGLSIVFREKPRLSVVVIFHNMRREAPRTLHSLSTGYQQVDFPYEVIAMDNGSSEPLTEGDVRRFGRQFHYVYHQTNSASPVSALNHGVRRAKSPYVMIMIDGARICSPGILELSRSCIRKFTNPFIYTLGFHLGDENQNDAMLKGYDQKAEDRILQDVDWRRDGYRLFDVSCLARSSSGGYFGTMAESNCFVISRRCFLSMGGYNEAFQTPGGGMANRDFFQRATSNDALTPICLLGEGTFHQFHGGVATNVPMARHPSPLHHAEYNRIYGKPLELNESLNPVFFGRMHAGALRFLSGDDR